MGKSNFINDPVHGTIIIDELENLLINTPHVQRLRNIQQLGLVDIIYPGAKHSRFEHSLGTMHVAAIIGKTLELNDEDIMKLRLSGLLHDVGHATFSHAVESVLKYNPDWRPLENEKFESHEDVTRYIISKKIPQDSNICNYIENNFGYNCKKFFQEIANIATGSTIEKKPYLSQIISGDIDADRIDFLLRDSYHTGISFGLIDMDHIIRSLIIYKGNVRLGTQKKSSYEKDMVLTAAESMLISRAHHYNAIIYHPGTQAARVMLFKTLQDALINYQNLEGIDKTKQKIFSFFTEYIDSDLLNFIRHFGSENSIELLQCIKDGKLYIPIIRFDQKCLSPATRMSVSTIARHGIAKMEFESRLIQKLPNLLIGLEVASGIPKSIRVLRDEEESFLYDESALANGLVRSISRQVSITAFVHPEEIDNIHKNEIVLEMKKEVDELSFKLLNFIRNDQYIPIEGVILLLYAIYDVFKKQDNEYISIPRVRHITFLYRIIQEFTTFSKLKNLFDYNFHEKYGFPYSNKLYEHIQILVAMGIVDEDLRYYEHNGRYKQSYEYILTRDGGEYASKLVKVYSTEYKEIKNYIKINKHSVPKDMVTIANKRYTLSRN